MSINYGETKGSSITPEGYIPDWGPADEPTRSSDLAFLDRQRSLLVNDATRIAILVKDIAAEQGIQISPEDTQKAVAAWLTNPSRPLGDGVEVVAEDASLTSLALRYLMESVKAAMKKVAVL